MRTGYSKSEKMDPWVSKSEAKGTKSEPKGPQKEPKVPTRRSACVMHEGVCALFLELTPHPDGKG